ncbi:MAG: hypothetical protein CO032_08295 [Nitrosopumilales archaeon CG_4_9_14_0_2_um_filter_34_16]|nr:MAG: hypothetical protein CO032_08295 [Nitrosopumilales archaeon CG_4_9_14_0_2_um_filter_34_16]
MKKRILILKKVKNDGRISRKELLEDPERHFSITLSVLDFMNKEITKIVTGQIPSIREKKLKDVTKQMTKKDRQEYSRWIKWTKTPPEKQRRFTTTKLVSIIFQANMDLFLHQNRFEIFLREMSLVYLITEFEEFLKDIVTAAIIIEPKILKKSGKSIDFHEILSTKDRDTLIDVMREKEVKSLINGDIDEIAAYLKKQFKIDLSSHKDWNQFKERFYRRHILIHNSLKPDKKYRAKSGYKGKEHQLSITNFYLKRSITLYKKFAKHITNEMIKKFS